MEMRYKLMTSISLKKKNGEDISVGYIVESGDHYIRFSDGTQICYDYHANDDYCNDNAYINFPKVFIRRPSLTVSRHLNKTNAINTGKYTDVFYNDLSNEGFTICGDSSTDLSNRINFSYIAIGRWK